ncbi:hypothetical protein AzCIB_1398 [Azoarcus sp. CIB]|uniref:hypothetical protein n=1 Tax=Aromatoleum sp. (strain CIB) TaxID=198107 RepID=UPI00067C388B|nr:hypothetical protein [Azoarcus sp. CIB]AKU11300.1 hypothetical protein AzCIB_1398 [Azoarcus sp. CIB]
MRDELVRELRAAHPALFAPDARISCRDGWHGLLSSLCRYLDSLVAAGTPAVQIREVKQKFGKLRIRAVGGDATTVALLEACEAASVYMCETCGQPGELVLARGVEVACPACRSAGAVPLEAAALAGILQPTPVVAHGGGR